MFRLEKPKIMALIIHAADISNAVKTWHIHTYTTAQLLQEFFEQVNQTPAHYGRLFFNTKIF